MGKMLHLEKIKYDKVKKEESLAPLSLYREDVICLYKDKKGVFLVTRQGFMHKIPYKYEDIRAYLEL